MASTSAVLLLVGVGPIWINPIKYGRAISNNIPREGIRSFSGALFISMTGPHWISYIQGLVVGKLHCNITTDSTGPTEKHNYG